MSKFTRVILFAATMLCGVPMARAQYSVVNTFKLGGPGRWDYALIDPDSKLLYLTPKGLEMHGRAIAALVR